MQVCERFLVNLRNEAETQDCTVRVVPRIVKWIPKLHLLKAQGEMRDAQQAS